jgi:hypothetical protein
VPELLAAVLLAACCLGSACHRPVDPDRLLAEPHHGSCPYWRNDPDEWPCDCGQDRLRTDCLTLLAEPYQEGLE